MMLNQIIDQQLYKNTILYNIDIIEDNYWA